MTYGPEQDLCLLAVSAKTHPTVRCFTNQSPSLANGDSRDDTDGFGSMQ